MPEITLNEKYKPLWESDCFIYLVTGGRGSGKSFAVGDFIENLSFEQDHKILFTRYTLKTADDSIIPEFQEKVNTEEHEGHFYTTKADMINTKSGSKILFRGIRTSSGDQTANLKSIQGLTTWVLDEAEELVDEKVFNKIKQSIRKKGVTNRIILILNPKSKDHWIYKRFFKAPGVKPDFNGEHEGVCYIHTTYLENLENLSKEFLDEAEKCRIQTYDIYKYDYLGEWVLSIEGALLKMDKLKRYTELNEEGTNLMYCDTADEGKDHFAAPIGRLYGNYVYITDALFNMVDLTVNEGTVTHKIQQHKIDNCYIETNSAGAYFKRSVQALNENTPIFGLFSKANKMQRILNQSGWVMEFMVFPEHPNEELSRFMEQMCSVTWESKDNDDAADAITGLAAMIRRDYLQT